MMSISHIGRWLTLAICCLKGIQALAQSESTPALSLDQTKKPPLVEIGGGIFEIGAVRLDKNLQAISFPASVNLTNVVIEYAIVGGTGKLHESLLVTRVQPYHIHLAALLLGMTNHTASVRSGQPLLGTPINIWVAWKSEEKEQKVRLEDLICKQQNGKPMDRGVWLYNGSRVVQGFFMAQAGESIVSIIEDIDALINNPREGREDDSIWYPNEKALPPANTAVTVSFEPEKNRRRR